MAKCVGQVRLILFFTDGVSLKTWGDVGMLEREVALYRVLRSHLRGVTFVTYGDAGDLRYAARLQGIRIICNWWRLPQRWYAKLVSAIFPWLWRGPVVVKSNQVQGADIALAAARRIRKKFVARCGYLLSDNMERAHGAESPQAKTACALEREVFTRADRVVVTTPAIREKVLQRYQLSPDRVRVIPNYVDSTVFAPTGNKERHAKRLCYVGRLDREKNPSALIAAVEGLDVELIVVGNGSLGEQLRLEVTRVGSAVQFLGNVPNRELPQILNSAAAFVMPSLIEGHPKALLEAMACGMPVIGTNVPGIRELICHRETGYLCECSPESIRAAIREVLEDGELRARMGACARAYVAEHFSLEKILDLELGLLEELTECYQGIT
jgi:glycosyltransferase involved in cell wall biosynthesis